jgi:glutathione S-transferase
MAMKLAYTALSPFCRKVRMAMEYKQLDFELVAGDHLTEVPAFNPRAEVPMLIDDDVVVCNSPDILAYVDRRFPSRPLYPTNARAYADVREWERYADTHVDAIMTVIGNWKFAELPPMPERLMAAARTDVRRVYDRLDKKLAGQSFVCGEISAADYALYPQVASGAALGLTLDRHAHGSVFAWLKRIRERPEGQSDLAAARHWWENRATSTVDTKRVNWGTFRLEWLLASGGVDFFVEQVRADKVLWSVGPHSHAKNHPLAPE